jgi:hypothetical protein
MTFGTPWSHGWRTSALPFLPYVGLLLAQHSTMMEARRALISELLWAVAERWVTRNLNRPGLRTWRLVSLELV